MMATAVLVLTGIVGSSGFTGATTANLNTSDNVRATGGAAGAFIKADITNAPTDYGTPVSFTVPVEWLLSATATRAKSVLVELRSADGATLYASASTPTKTTTTEQTNNVELTISQAPTKTELDAAQLWLTVQEGAGMADSATVSIDYTKVDLVYELAGLDGTATAGGQEATTELATGIAASGGAVAPATGIEAASEAGTATAFGPAAAEYRVHRSATSGFTPSGTAAGSGTCLAVVSSSTLEYSDTTVTPGTTRYYKVEAVNASGSSVSNQVALTSAAVAVATGVEAATELGAAVATVGVAPSATGIEAATELGTTVARVSVLPAAAGLEAASELGSTVARGAATAVANGLEAASELGTATASGSGAGTAVAQGLESVTELGTTVATGTAGATAVGAEALSELGATIGRGAATAAATGLESTTELGTSVGRGSGTAAATGTEAATEMGTATAYGPGAVNGTATATGIEVLTELGLVLVTAEGRTTVIGIEAATEGGITTALGSGSGVAQAVGLEATTERGAVTASGVVFPPGIGTFDGRVVGGSVMAGGVKGGPALEGTVIGGRVFAGRVTAGRT